MGLILIRLLSVLLIAAGVFGYDSAQTVQTPGPAEACFVPGLNDCADRVSAYIEDATQSIDVQAYNFTQPTIIHALIDAHKRGIKVRIILDKISPSQKGEGADPVADAGIPTFIDHHPKIAHNKVMIIDGNIVITGSFNFSTNADTENAENVLILQQDTDLAALYEQNFEKRLAASTPYTPKE